MKFTAKFGTVADAAANAGAHCLIIPRVRALPLARALKVSDAVKPALAGAPPGTGKAVRVFLGAKPSVLIIVGDESKQQSAKEFTSNMAAAAAALAQTKIGEACICIGEFNVKGRDAYWKTVTALNAVSGAAYSFEQYRSKKNDKRPSLATPRVSVLADARTKAQTQRAVKHAKALAEGIGFAKDLGNHPPNVCDPAFLAKEARKLGAGERVSVNVLSEAQMEKLGMGAFLSVTRASAKPAKMIIVDYKGGKRNDAPTVLIGKGITFDTGGSNLKTTEGMASMKFDMCGAAGVLGVAKAAIAAKLPINLVTIVAAAENMPGGRASRPSDVVTTMSGATVEIMNTDAEGRLVLCDAMTYAMRYKPRAMVDVATLTGGQIIALGSVASALFSNNDALAEALAKAGDKANDRMWRMPVWDEYQAMLKSPVADMKNVGGREASSVTAACFLARFAGDVPWAHIDIAGPAFRNNLSTGRPVGALFQYLIESA